MTLQMRHLRLRAMTPRGLFGADISLGDGLVVLRADNSRGKSTAVKSLLYVLGMERMITARSASTVTAAMRDNLIYDRESKAETPVLESYVSLEVSNHREQTVTLTRWVKHTNISDGLIRIANGPALTEPDSYATEDYYVGRAGSASNPRGFHRWLADFIGWQMPDLPARDGRVAPLYMEQVFPLLFVEQRRGWGGIQAQMPYFSGVSDVRRRAIEFLLNLEVGRRELERQQLVARMRELEANWQNAIRLFNVKLSGEGLATSGLPAHVSLTWPPAHPVFLFQSQGDEWVPIDSVLEQLRNAEQGTPDLQVRTIGELATEEEDQLQAATERAERLQERGSFLRDEILRDRTELNAVRAKLDALREDQRQYQDVLVLERLGSPLVDRLDDDCPVCHQALPPSLLGSRLLTDAMSPEDSVNYIKQQIQLFEVMAEDGERALAAKNEKWAAIRRESAEVRSEIRRLRTDLTQREDTLSVEDVAERFLRRQRIERLESIQDDFRGLKGELLRTAEAATVVKSSLDAMPKERLSENDLAKLGLLERSFVAQLREYDFGSFSDERLAISKDDYLPRRDDFDLQADISASDSIRVVWAYLIGLMEVAEKLLTNHPGFLVFDEPRQQSTKGLSFQALLRRAAHDAKAGQILFATSEELGSLTDMLAGLDFRLHVIDGYLLKQVSE
ncbi:hypothetical protein ABZ754_00485 [Micromonospora purpureochromogenes]|uniref:hypothetical protein n=1 Tax=Micromonospora purpureochromogenes TaxID=47872 RepID=UPI003404F613